MKIYLLFDSVMKYSLTDDPKSFQDLTVSQSIGVNKDENIEWLISSHDSQLDTIKISSKAKINGKKPVKGNWKDTWTEKPKKIDSNHFQGVLQCGNGTNPEVFAWSVSYTLKKADIQDVQGGDDLDSSLWFPPPAPDPGIIDG